ncbi:MAG TPA: hypothetical protein VGL99_06155 [Chloroflexota bacterium]
MRINLRGLWSAGRSKLIPLVLAASARSARRVLDLVAYGQGFPEPARGGEGVANPSLSASGLLQVLQAKGFALAALMLGAGVAIPVAESHVPGVP